MRKLVMALVVVLAAAGCGGSTSASSAPGATPAPAVVSQDCADSLAPFLDALKSLSSRLDIGLTYADYGSKLGDVKTAYDDVDFKKLDASCISAIGVDAEAALNHYITAYTTWHDCISSTSCSNDSIKPKLQAEWASASTLIKKIRDQLP